MIELSKFLLTSRFTFTITMLLLAILILCVNYTQYLPITADDFNGIYADVKYEGFTQNRLWWIITAPIGQFVMRSLFSLRWVYGAHVFFYFVPVFVLVFYFWSIFLKREAFLGLAILLSIKILGYEHSAPLCYPVMHSLMLGLSMWAGLSIGILTTNKIEWLNPKFLFMMFVGCLSVLWYEYYPLIFFICAAWSNWNNLNEKKYGILYKPFTLLIYLTPLFMIVMFKLFGFVFFGNNPEFSTYAGTNISLSDFSIDYIFESAAIALQHLLGATIIQHTKKALTWPPILYELQLNPTTIIFGSFIALSVFFIIMMPNENLNRVDINKIHRSRKNNYYINYSRCNVALLATGLLTFVQLILHSISPKYRIWTEAAGFWSGITFLNGSLAIISACFFVSILIIKIIDSYAGRSHYKIYLAGILSIFVLILSLYTMTHNLIVSKLINERAYIYQNIISSCDLFLQKNMDYFSNPPNYIYPFTLPIPIHPTSFEGNWSETMCHIYRNDPNLFKNWKDIGLTYEQQIIIIKCGSLPATNSELTQCIARDKNP